MPEEPAGTGKAQARPPFFPAPRALHVALSILTLGAWLLALLSRLLWRRGRRRLAAVSGGAFVLLVILVAIGIASGGSSSPTSTSSQSSSSSAKTTAAADATADAKAKGSIERALKVLASNYQDFGDYELITPVTLGNIDHRLRGISSLAATGHGKRFSVSIRSTSGTTFTVHGVGLKLVRTCSPAGRNCPNGHWAGAAVLVLPKVPVVTAAEKAKVRKILTASVDHYADLLSQGEQALGSTQYATATAGLSAFNDPNSAASRFRDYRQKSKVESDLSYINAFKKADSFYTAANEPKSISTWGDDMDTVSADLNSWVNLAVGWQIKEKTTAQLQASERKIQVALAKARHDIDRIVAGH